MRYNSTFPEHAFGLPAHITRFTHKYGPGSADACHLLGICGTAPPFLYSDDASEFYWIVPKTDEDLEWDMNADPERYSEEAKEAVRRRVEQTAEHLQLAPADCNDDEASPPSKSPGRFHEPSPRNDARDTCLTDTHIGRTEDTWEPLSTDPHPKPIKSSANNQNENPSKKPSSNPNRKHANHLRYEADLNRAGPSNAHRNVQPPLPDLAPSASNDDEQSPPPRTPERVCGLPFRLDGCDIAKRPRVGSTLSSIIETAASSRIGSWEEADAVQVGRLDTGVVAKSPSPEPTPSPGDKPAASPPLASWLEADEGQFIRLDSSAVAQPSRSRRALPISHSAAASRKAQNRSDASAVTQPHAPKSALLAIDDTAAHSLPTSPEEEEGGFTLVTRRHKLKLNANPDTRIRGFVDTYQSRQKVFEGALAGTSVSEADREEFFELFERDADGQPVKTKQILRAATIARGSPAWTAESSRGLMHALWDTIFHREAAGAWYARMDVRDKRVKDDKGHRDFIVVLKAAWGILNDGVEYDPKSPSNAK